MKKLDISHNRLKALPDTFGDLHLLTYLHVSHNALLELPPSCSLGCINLVREGEEIGEEGDGEGKGRDW